MSDSNNLRVLELVAPRIRKENIKKILEDLGEGLIVLGEIIICNSDTFSYRVAVPGFSDKTLTKQEHIEVFVAIERLTRNYMLSQHDREMLAVVRGEISYFEYVRTMYTLGLSKDFTLLSAQSSDNPEDTNILG